MPFSCVVKGCNGKPNKEFNETLGNKIKHQFHVFPASEERRKKWFDLIGADEKIKSIKDRK